MVVRLIRAARVAALCLMVPAAGLLAPAATAAVAVQSVSQWKQDAAPVAWTATPDLVYYNAVGANGLYEGYSANPDGSDPTCLTCTAPSFRLVGAATQRGVSDVSSDGQYMLLEVEDPRHLGPVGGSISEPGKGVYDDVWLARTDGTAMWPLTDVTALGSGVIGTMWARFSPSGNQIVFAEMYGTAAGTLGYWKLIVATIVWNGGIPSLADETVINPSPDHFMEPYGFTPDGTKVIFASDIGQASWTDSQIFEVATDGSDLTQISPESPNGLFTNYNEFAFPLPSGDGIVYGSSQGSTTGGLDYWLMNPDGSDAQRLTYFNEPWSSESQGYETVGSLAFNPADPDQFLAAVTNSPSGQTQNAVMVTLSDPTSSGGLAAQYFSNSTDFEGTPITGTGNPSSGLQWLWGPQPGVSSDYYSVRYTGLITPPVTGAYAFCLVSDGAADLYVGGQMVINAQSAPGQHVCGTVQAVGGQALQVRIDYSHGQGTAYLQLTWIPPGSGAGFGATLGGSPVDWSGTAQTGDIIPAGDMTPVLISVPAATTPPPVNSSTSPGAATTSTAAVHSTTSTGKSATGKKTAGKKTSAKGSGATAVIARARHRRARRRRAHRARR